MARCSGALGKTCRSCIGFFLYNINQQGISVLLVEQNAAMALRLANRVYVIKTGRIVLSGERDELLDNDKVKKAYLGG